MGIVLLTFLSPFFIHLPFGIIEGLVVLGIILYLAGLVTEFDPDPTISKKYKIFRIILIIFGPIALIILLLFLINVGGL